jgi:hypothetical protein
MASPKVSVRVEGDLMMWVDAYALKRGVTRSAVVNGALEAFRELCRSRVPDLGARVVSAGQGRVAGAGGPISSRASAPPVVSRPAAGGAPRAMSEAMVRRQERLNRAKGMKPAP